MCKGLRLHDIFTFICQQKWQYIIVNNISNISKEQWLAVRLCEETEPYYWDLVGKNLLPHELIYWVESECMNVYECEEDEWDECMDISSN